MLQTEVEQELQKKQELRLLEFRIISPNIKNHPR